MHLHIHIYHFFLALPDPNLTTLYDLVGVPFADADYSFSCSLGKMDNGGVGSYFRYANYCNMRFALPAWGGFLTAGLWAAWKYCVLMFEALWFFFFAPLDMKVSRREKERKRVCVRCVCQTESGQGCTITDKHT